MAIDSWSKCRIRGRWTDAEGNFVPGTFKTEITDRLTNSTFDAIIPAGLFKPGTGTMRTGDATDLTTQSLDFQAPATDDADVIEKGWAVRVTVNLTGYKAETFTLTSVPSGGDIDLRQMTPDTVTKTIIAQSSIPLTQFVRVNDDGTLSDGNGNTVTPSGVVATDASAFAVSADAPTLTGV